MRALLAALLGAVTGVTLCALVGAIQMQTHAMRSPSADLRPDTAWLFGALWFAFGFGPAAGRGRGRRRSPRRAVPRQEPVLGGRGLTRRCSGPAWRRAADLDRWPDTKGWLDDSRSDGFAHRRGAPTISGLLEAN